MCELDKRASKDGSPDAIVNSVVDNKYASTDSFVRAWV